VQSGGKDVGSGEVKFVLLRGKKNEALKGGSGKVTGSGTLERERSKVTDWIGRTGGTGFVIRVKGKKWSLIADRAPGKLRDLCGGRLIGGLGWYRDECEYFI